MKGDVGFQRIVQPVLGRPHAREPRVDPSDVLVPDDLRSKRGAFRLERDAQFVELAQQFDRKLAFQHPAQHVGVEQAP